MFPKRGPYGNKRPFPEPCLAYSPGFPVKQPSLKVALIKCTVGLPTRRPEFSTNHQLDHNKTIFVYSDNIINTFEYPLGLNHSFFLISQKLAHKRCLNIQNVFGHRSYCLQSGPNHCLITIPDSSCTIL
jgi:hypothetical protein